MNSTVPLVDQIPGFSGTFEDMVSILQAVSYSNFVSLPVTTFDALLTIEQEIRLVWQGRWGMPSVLYLLIRYGSVAQAALTSVPTLDFALTGQACLAWNLFANWSLPVLLLLVEAMLAIRVSALYFNSRIVVIALSVMWLGAGVSMLALMGVSLVGAFPVPSPAPPTLGCGLNSSNPAEAAYWTLWLPSAIFETVVALMTLGRAIYYKPLMKTTPLFKVLFRDGFVYFFVIFAFMLANIVITATTNVLYTPLIDQLTVSIGCCMASRLFLNLRETAQRGAAEQQSYSAAYELSALPVKSSGPIGGGYSPTLYDDDDT